MTPQKTLLLLVDDEPDFLFLVKNRLEANGYRVTTAPDGTAALEAVKKERPDLILLDVLMPKMDGYEALEELRGVRGTRQIPVIMFSAKGQPDDLKLSKELGATDYLLKPFDPNDLLQKIEKALSSV